MNSFALSRFFWDFAFENTGKIKPIHTAIYFFAVEHCNRLGWKRNFGLPTSMVLEAITVKSYSVYKSAFDDLVEFGFFEVIQYSKNQYSSNIIALKENYKANNKASIKALDKAMIKHAAKQTQSNGQSSGSIDKPLTINQEPQTNSLEFFGFDTSKAFVVEKKYIHDNSCKVYGDGLKDYCNKYLSGLWFKKSYYEELFWKEWDGKLFNGHSHVNNAMMGFNKQTNG